MMKNHVIVGWFASGAVHCVTIAVLAWSSATSHSVEAWPQKGGVVLQLAFAPEDAANEPLSWSICAPRTADEHPYRDLVGPEVYRRADRHGALPSVPQPLTPQKHVELPRNVRAFPPPEARPRNPSEPPHTAAPTPKRPPARFGTSGQRPQALVQVAVPVSQPSRSDLAGGAVDQLPRKLQTNPAPPYPPDAYARRQQGRVLLEVRVNQRGLVDDVSVSKSSGVASLDQAALETVRSWRFEPARRGGRPAATVVIVPVRFVIRGLQ